MHDTSARKKQREMDFHPRRGAGSIIPGRRSVIWIALLALNQGCVSPWWNGFLAPQEVGNFQENRVNEIQRSISFRDKPMGLAGAVEPGPEDLVAQVQEYTIGPGDNLAINLLDFLQLGVETPLNPVVDEIGYIHIPQLGWLYVEGMTARQLQAEIIRRAKEAGIYAQDANPVVAVQVLTKQHQIYNISGAIPAPGPYPIIRPDFRLREAINQAGGLPDMVKNIYVFRNGAREKRVEPARSTIPSAAGGPKEPGGPPAPPVTPASMAEMSTAGSPPAHAAAPPSAPTTRENQPSELVLPKQEAEQELMEALAPASGPTPEHPATQAPVQEETGAPATSPRMPTFIYVNGQFIEAPAEKPAPTTSIPAAKPTAPAAPRVEKPQEPVDWEALALGGEQRVLQIPAQKLREGDPNYNIVIRPQDWIRLDPGPVGLYYVDGHVLRPGVYNLSGQEITLTQAIAAAGGLDPIAWPTRCEVRRRIEGDREEITQWDLSRIIDGRDPDMFIKEGDVIRVGTHAVAPLLATIRNAFRLTYGFGFVYDRNFADIDSFYGRANPDDFRRSIRLQQGILP